jgi:oligopeptide/dipeptide ABC transporter ATP-binding protein
MLNVEGLSVSFRQGGILLPAVRNLQFALSGSEALAIVGESGSGKTLTGLAVMGLLPHGAVARGRIYFSGRMLVVGRDSDWDDLRGRSAAMVFQNPAAALNPVIKVGRQVSETLEFHYKISRKEADTKTLQLFSALGIAPAGRRFHQYPHQLSGGLQQRVMIAVAGALEPPLLIADEPTSALDLTIQSQVLDLLTAGVRERGRALLLITHDLGVVARTADRVLVMCAGVMVEEAAVKELFERACHPYTRMLLQSVPRLDRKLSSKLPCRPLNFRTASGCPYLPYCRRAIEKCRQLPPPLNISPTHRVCCHLAGGRRHV